MLQPICGRVKANVVRSINRHHRILKMTFLWSLCYAVFTRKPPGMSYRRTAYVLVNVLVCLFVVVAFVCLFVCLFVC